MKKEQKRQSRMENPGFVIENLCLVKTQTGWCKQKIDHPLSELFEGLKNHQFTLFGNNDDYIAIVKGKSLLILKFDEVGHFDKKRSCPVTEVKSKIQFTHVVASGSRRPLEIIIADTSGSIWSYNFNNRSSKPSQISITEKPSIQKIGVVNEKIYQLIKTRKKLFVQTDNPDSKGYRLYEIDYRTKQIESASDLLLDRMLSTFDSRNNDLLIGFEKGELRVINFKSSSRAKAAQVTALEIPRVSTATLFNKRYLLVAQKGGGISKIDVLKASAVALTPQSDAIERACKLLCKNLRRCGCIKPCDCPSSTPVDPNRPGGGIIDDEPCGERHTVKLQWTAKRLALVGQYIVAFSANNKRMAVFDQKMNLIFERYLGQSNISVNTGHAKTQRMIIVDPRKHSLEAWSLSDYVNTISGTLPRDLELIPPGNPTEITYYGNRYQRTAPNPTLKVCVFTVTEPGQSFTDPNQNQLLSQIEPNVFDIVNDYYDETSYGDLDVQFSVFGADFGGTRIPLILPQPMVDYFYDDFTPGGLEAVMPADWTNPVILDGTESLELHTNPRLGSGKDYTVPFAALWTSKPHNSYPVVIDFDGTENLQLTVENQEGNTHILDLNFNAITFTHNQGDEENDFLNALGNYITDVIRNSEASLAGNPLTIQEVTFRRIRSNDNDNEFGRLQGQFRVAPPADSGDVIQKGRILVSTLPSPLPPALEALGFTTSANRSGELTSRAKTQNYFNECLSATQADHDEGPGSNDPHFNNMVQTDEDVALQELTVKILLTNNKGGQGASIDILSYSGLNGTGWDTASALPGSESNANNQNTLWYSAQLADDVFTAALDHVRAIGPWKPEEARTMFKEFDAMMIAFVGAPSTSGLWGANDPVDINRLRMFRRTHIASDQNNPNSSDTPVSMNTDVVIGQKFKGFKPGLMAHELGHALGLPDIYFASGFRDDVLYINNWGMMAGGNENLNHFCGWSKWSLGWIYEDSNDDLNRVVDVPLPNPSGTSITEAWLVPVEYWDNSIKDDVRSQVGGTLPIVQLMKVHLGSDGGIINFIELRSPGDTYSMNLPPSPSVIVTNVLDPESDRRWAVNGLYRRKVHRLNQGNELRNAGDKWDFAAGAEFPLKGCTVEIMDIKTIRGGTIPVYHLKVEREQADYIDLYFQDHVPSYRSPDIWVDWPGDNPDSSIPYIYPEGTPSDQGETVRFPSSGVEKHFLVARVHNAGTVRAEDVKVRWFICDPPGSGDNGRWIQKDTLTIPEVGPSSFEIAAFNWNVDSSTNIHQCMRAEIIDWTIPSEVDPSTGDTLHLASDDVKLQNNNAQQNVFDFEALAGSPFDEIIFQMQVYNDYLETEVAALVPNGLPWGATLRVSPAEAHIKPGTSQVFNCTLSLDEKIIKPGCDNDKGFLLTAWRRAEDSDENWGSCFYFIRPRYKTQVKILRGYWVNNIISVYGEWKVVTTDEVDISTEKPLFVRVRLVIHDGNGEDHITWYSRPIDNSGNFELSIFEDVTQGAGASFSVQAWFDRTNLLSSSVSKAVNFKQQILE